MESVSRGMADPGMGDAGRSAAPDRRPVDADRPAPTGRRRRRRVLPDGSGRRPTRAHRRLRHTLGRRRSWASTHAPGAGRSPTPCRCATSRAAPGGRSPTPGTPAHRPGPPREAAVDRGRHRGAGHRPLRARRPPADRSGVVLASVRDATPRRARRAGPRRADLHRRARAALAADLRQGLHRTLLRRWDRFTDDQKRFMLETVDADADRRHPAHHRAARRLPDRRGPPRRAAAAGRPRRAAQPPRRAAAWSSGYAEAASSSRSPTPRLPEVWADPDKSTRSSATCWKTRCGTALVP